MLWPLRRRTVEVMVRLCGIAVAASVRLGMVELEAEQRRNLRCGSVAMGIDVIRCTNYFGRGYVGCYVKDDV